LCVCVCVCVLRFTATRSKTRIFFQCLNRVGWPFVFAAIQYVYARYNIRVFASVAFVWPNKTRVAEVTANRKTDKVGDDCGRPRRWAEKRCRALAEQFRTGNKKRECATANVATLSSRRHNLQWHETFLLNRNTITVVVCHDTARRLLLLD